MRGLLGVREAVQVALRRVGILILALSHEDALHACLSEEERTNTLTGELGDIEAILQVIQTEAEAEALAAEAERMGQA